MYEEFYKLDRAPFDTTPDPTFFFMSDGHQEALAALVYGIDRRKGFISMIGEVGTGKTTVLRAYIESEHVKNTRIIYLFNPRVSYEDLLLMVLRELRVEIPDGETKRVDLLHRVLVNEYKNGNNVVLIVDEAQNIPPETLESMRMLSNLETSSEKLIQIVLSGQPELDDILNSNRLRQLRQRIAVKVRLEALSRSEAGDYVRYRLRRAGGDDGVFTKDAIDWVVRYTGGNPRSINVLCDNALITGYGYQQFPISTPIIKEIAKEFDIKSLSTDYGTKSETWLRAAGAVFAVTGVAGLFYLWSHFSKESTDTTPTLATPAASESNAEAVKVEPAIAVNPVQEDDGTVVESDVKSGDDVVNISNGDNVDAIDAQPEDDDQVEAPEAVGQAVIVDEDAIAQNTESNFESVIQASPEETEIVDTAAESAPQPVESTSQPSTTSEDTQNSPALSVSDSVTNRVQRSDAGDQTLELTPAVSTNQTVDEAPADDAQTESSIAEAAVEQTQANEVKQATGVVVSDAQPIEAAGSDSVVIIDGVRQTVGAAEQLPTVVLSSDTDTGVDTGVDAGIENTTSDSLVEDTVESSTPQEDSTSDSASASEAEPVAVVEVETTDETIQQAVRIVNSGDNLWDMTREVYGRVNERIVERVMERNPDLTSASAIYVGQKIVFPEL